MKVRTFMSVGVAVLAVMIVAAERARALSIAQVTDMAIVDPAGGGNADGAAGAYSGNDKPAAALDLLNVDDIFGLGLAFSLAGSSDDAAAGPFSDNPEDTAGLLTFDAAITDPFVIALKAGNAFSLYYFANSLGGVSGLSFVTDGVYDGKNLSHASLYVAAGDPGDPGDDPDPSTDPGPQPGAAATPEPATAALALLGLGGLMMRRTRRDA